MMELRLFTKFRSFICKYVVFGILRDFPFMVFVTLIESKLVSSMEDGGVVTTVMYGRQHKMGQMVDFPLLLASSVFDL